MASDTHTTNGLVIDGITIGNGKDNDNNPLETRPYQIIETTPLMESAHIVILREYCMHCVDDDEHH